MENKDFKNIFSEKEITYKEWLEADEDLKDDFVLISKDKYVQLDYYNRSKPHQQVATPQPKKFKSMPAIDREDDSLSSKIDRERRSLSIFNAKEGDTEDCSFSSIIEYLVVKDRFTNDLRWISRAKPISYGRTINKVEDNAETVPVFGKTAYTTPSEYSRLVTGSKGDLDVYSDNTAFLASDEEYLSKESYEHEKKRIEEHLNITPLPLTFYTTTNIDLPNKSLVDKMNFYQDQVASTMNELKEELGMPSEIVEPKYINNPIQSIDLGAGKYVYNSERKQWEYVK